MLRCTPPHSAGEHDVRTETAVRAATINAWMTEAAGAVRAQRDYLTQLDAAIGDGDHGTNMDRGFAAVEKALAGQNGDLPPGRLLIVAGKTLVSTVGGASGPLWGSALRAAGRSLGDAQDLDGQALAGALDAAIAAVVDLGAAAPGDKTMIDALMPASDALRRALESDAPLQVAVASASEAAEDGARATVPLLARKGRASYLGERSIGHQDPGATSAALILRALGGVVPAEVSCPNGSWWGSGPRGVSRRGQRGSWRSGSPPPRRHWPRRSDPPPPTPPLQLSPRPL